MRACRIIYTRTRTSASGLFLRPYYTQRDHFPDPPEQKLFIDQQEDEENPDDREMNLPEFYPRGASTPELELETFVAETVLSLSYFFDELGHLDEL